MERPFEVGETVWCFSTDEIGPVGPFSGIFERQQGLSAYVKIESGSIRIILWYNCFHSEAEARKNCGKLLRVYYKNSCQLRDRLRERLGLEDEGEALARELRHLVNLLAPLEQEGTLRVPGLATLNGARKALDDYEGLRP